MSAATTVSQVRPVISKWVKGKRSDERGWSFDGVSLSLSDILATRSFVELQKKGVPASICDTARREGFMPTELGLYLDETY